MRRSGWILGLTMVMVGCGSNVKLNEVPVEDKTPVTVGPTKPATGEAGTRPVAGVDLSKPAPDAAGPTGVARIVYFDFDSYIIRPEFQGLIDQHAQFAKSSASRRVVVEGHTDERGGREYNLALGQRRAEAVRRSLVLLGVRDGQTEAVSFGKEKPADPGRDEAAMAKNRRAELVYRQ